MSSAPYMPLYIGDYLADTVHLNGAESGAYLHLLMCMWRAGGSLPNDPAKLARFCKLTPQAWARVESAVMDFFTVDGRVITQKRLVEELTKYEVALNVRRERASAGGKAKALKNKGEGLPQAGRKRANQNHNQNQDIEGEDKSSPLSSAGAGDGQDEGERKEDPPEKPRADEVRVAFNAWNNLAQRLGLPAALKLDEPRRKAIKARLADGGLAAWMDALKAVEASAHCRGTNDRNWRADLTFVCQAKSWRRLLEGSYGAEHAPAAVPGPGACSPERWQAYVEIFAEDGRWRPDLGPKPGEPGCRAPPDVLRALGFLGAEIVPFDRSVAA